jgi:hypothetical protein
MTEKKTHANTLKAADISLAKKQISPDSYRAVHEGRITIDEARELGREGSPFGPAPKTISKDDRTPTKTPCLCGCGKPVARSFAPGHDQRLVTFAKEYVRGERDLTPEQLEYVEQSGKLERAKAQVAKENAKRQECAAKAEANSKK